MYDVSGSKSAAMVAMAGHMLVGLLLAGSVNSIDTKRQTHTEQIVLFTNKGSRNARVNSIGRKKQSNAQHDPKS
jgi:hypothetical protein